MRSGQNGLIRGKSGMSYGHGKQQVVPISVDGDKRSHWVFKAGTGTGISFKPIITPKSQIQPEPQ